MSGGPLEGRVCVVAGASRGVGRGVAVGLGEAGATVICSGRSTRFGHRTEGRRETVEDAAEAVEQAGGKGYPYVCDHTDPKALYDFAAWVLRRFGAPSLVACAVWGGNEGFDGDHYADGSRYGTPFFARPLQPFETAMLTGPYAVLATARAFAPVMMPAGRGLFVSVGFDAADAYLGDVFYDLGKAGILRAARAMAAELAPHGLASVHLTPGFVRTERVLDAGHGPMATQSPLYAGRAVAALAALDDPMALNGQSLFVADLARRFGFTDIDGTQPPRFDISAPPPAGPDSAP
ncbi:SDR family NAD(P)-dependent oxidoreductase [Alsobacter sp. SYSU M60028]|uniref:SDR family NAD(P)-dependent oxidoreductase n=1 Tax=Alsobacter ponti TaxID=2962936 RepID=A0ABT1LC20_9HYPH|nr:SDR family NAD(P)-dependent oxidoreductase [Alsobacter ponti]